MMKKFVYLKPIAVVMSLCMFVLSFLIPFQSASAEVIHHEKYDMKWAYSPQYGKDVRTELLKNASGQIAYCLVYGKKSPDGHDLPEIGRTDDVVYRVLLNGYPQKTPEQLGVSTWQQAHYATQVSIWIALGQLSADDLQFKDAEVERATKAITYAADHTGDTQDVYMNVKPTDKQEAQLNGEYFETTTYTVETNAKKGEFKVQTNQVPAGTRIVTEQGEAKETFQLGEKFRVQVPKLSKSSELSLKVMANLTNQHAVVYQGTDTVQDATVLLERNQEKVSQDLQVFWKSVGGLKILKVDENKTPLAGAMFEVWDQNQQSVGTITTNEKGIASLQNIEIGTYTVKEVKSPSGYVLNDQPQKIEVKTGEVATITVANTKVKGNIEIKKLSDSGKVLPKVEFTVYTADGKEVTKTVTNEQGIAKVENLPFNKYFFKETKGVDGYLVNDTKYPFTIQENGKTLTFTVENKEVKGNVQLLKVDAENPEKKLAGVKFLLQNSEGKTVSEHTTDDNGLIKVENLPFGSYTFVEKQTLENYVLAKEPIPFQITEQGKTIELVAKNQPIKGELEITKVDIANGNTKLPNAEFTIFNEKGEVVVKGKTNEQGIATFKLGHGKYTYKETIAPDGYVLNEEIFPFEIKENGQIIRHTVKNAKKPTPEVPKPEQPKKPDVPQPKPEQPKVVEQPVKVQPVKAVEQPKKVEGTLPTTGGKEENPYWMWIGGIVMLLGGFVAIRAYRSHRKANE
ncbi:thioester domain-containing protein [Bacillus sp. TL12]|uniref:thioester domain-containing protein n=1 Tax=Bacillus sp. TL12 TaxID=2894756 RepID=UPI001F51C6A7|nr:thioester domain-containing protein [Bacillus sp. TL12]MCI0767283.1 Cys-Gln thioester bond-forming surface protein [Bacillus sp. TL12]